MEVSREVLNFIFTGNERFGRFRSFRSARIDQQTAEASNGRKCLKISRLTSDSAIDKKSHKSKQKLR